MRRWIESAPVFPFSGRHDLFFCVHHDPATATAVVPSSPSWGWGGGLISVRFSSSLRTLYRRTEPARHFTSLVAYGWYPGLLRTGFAFAREVAGCRSFRPRPLRCQGATGEDFFSWRRSFQLTRRVARRPVLFLFSDLADSTLVFLSANLLTLIDPFSASRVWVTLPVLGRNRVNAEVFVLCSVTLLGPWHKFMVAPIRVPSVRRSVFEEVIGVRQMHRTAISFT